MRIILDTNVFISAIFWRGAPNEILRLAEAGTITCYASPVMLRELFGVIERKKFRSHLEQAQLSLDVVREKVLRLVQVVMPTVSVRRIRVDPTDNEFLACAQAVKAACIVSGDRHLLALRQFRGIPIFTPEHFLRWLKR